MNQINALAPDWDRLFEIAAAQDGHFTTRQAAEAGYSTSLLVHYVRTGRFVRVRHGIYRLKHFPAADQEPLTEAWLWSDMQGVFSHRTALALYRLSDILPAKVHMTLPADWRKRRLKVPADVVLHFADVPLQDRDWYGPVPVTKVARTLNDCARDHLSPELLAQAYEQALERGLARRTELAAVEAALALYQRRSA